MKANLLLILPAMLLASCSTTQVQSYVNVDDETVIYYADGLPHVRKDGSTHVTYLLMSPYGSLNVSGASVKGEVSEKFYENTIVWEAAAGTPLPSSASEVTSSVTGATFRGWAYYSEDSEEIFPEYYKTVPSTSGLALKAIFDGTISSGSGEGGGGSGGGGGGGTTQTGFGIYFSDDNKVSGAAKGVNMDGRDEYLCSSVSFTENQTFKIYDFANSVAFIEDFNFNQWSFGSQGDGAKISSYVTVEGSAWKAVKAFTADVYIQLKYQDNCIYFELK